MANFLKITYKESDSADINTFDYEHRNKPFANGPVYETFVQDVQALTQGPDVKPAYRLRLDIKDYCFDYLPGDVIAILPENNAKEVESLIERLNLTNQCRLSYHLSIEESSKKSIPKHLPETSTLYEVFLKHVCIRSAPKKLFLKSLIRYTHDPKERTLLELVCSPNGSAEYVKLLQANRTLLSLLQAFPSCQPSVETILEHVRPLNPRYFSIASSPLSKQLWIIFNVVDIGNGLKGLCTGWLENIIKEKQFTKAVPVYFRKPGKFRFDNSNASNILIATGTGLAPFMGFLEHKDLGGSAAETWLFYGCRYSQRDFLCKKALLNYTSKGTLTNMCLAFSRDNIEKRYVQHKIGEHQQELAEWIFNKEAVIYVCGEVKTVVSDVKEALVKCVMAHKKCDRSAGCLIVEELVKSDRILIDSWL